MATGRGRQEGGNGEGKMGEVSSREASNRDRKRMVMGRGITWRERWRLGPLGAGKMGRGQRGRGKGERCGVGEVEKKEKEEGKCHRWI